jgi:hypothetical protein
MNWGNRLVIGILLFFIYVNGAAQTNPTPVPGMKTVTFASPNVTNMTKFGNIPIGLATGTPQISVPFYTVKIGDISVPLSLNYHASGIKVSEDASWAGLGWSLDAGGNITREVRGTPDEVAYGYLSGGGRQAVSNLTNNAYPFISGQFLTYGSTTSQGDQELQNIVQGLSDTQADLFHYSCGKYTGNFFFNQQGNVVQVPEQNVIIQFNGGTEGTSAFTIATPEGLVYHYGPIYELVAPNNSNPYASSWFLEEIDDQYGNKVSFNYTQYNYSAWSFGSETEGFLSVQNNNLNSNSVLPQSFDNQSFVLNNVGTAVLSSIQTKNETIAFSATSNRQDIPGEYALNSIKVTSNFTGQVAHELDLYTSYMGSGAVINGYTPNTLMRLELDSVLIDQAQKYKFSYDPTPLPARMSFAQDFWGYYNGVENTSMAPYFLQWLSPTTWFYTPGANRIPNPLTVSAGTLEKMVYPTGGSTTFTYEPNTIYDLESNLLPYSNPMLSEHSGIYASTQNTQGTNYLQPIDYTAGSTPITITFQGLAVNNSPFVWSTKMIDSATQGLVFNQIITNGETLTPPIGTYLIVYTIQGATGGTSDPAQSYLINAGWSVPTYPYNAAAATTYINVPVGGIRIKEMDDYDPVGNLTDVHAYQYTQTDGVNSSGQIVDYPIFNQVAPYISFLGLNNDDGSCTMNETTSNMQLLTSYSQVPIAINSGEVIGYSRVTELEGLGANQRKKVYQYTNVSSNPDIKALPQYDFPVTPYSSQYFNRGLLLDEMDYKNVAGGFQPSHETTNYYTTLNGFGVENYCTNSVLAVYSPTVYTAPGSQCVNGAPAEAQQDAIAWSVYEIISGFNHLDSTAEINYDQDDATSFTRTVTAFTWTNPFMAPHSLLVPRTKTFVNSKGESMMSNYTYAFDLAGATAATTFDNGINNLLGRSLYTRLVEASTYKNFGGAQTFLRSNLYNYDPVSPEITQQYAIDNGEAGGVSGFQPVSVVSGQIQQDPNYILRQSNDLYDGFGNLLQKHKAYDNLHSYIWDYHASYPVAEVINAGQGDVAYCGFEADGTGNWAFTGSTSYDVNAFAGMYDYSLGQGTISRSGLTSGTTYVVSYWSEGGPCSVSGSTGSPIRGKTINGWTYYEHQVSGQGSVTVSGSSTVDELRLYPAGAQMTTYSYLPSVGISESCDVGNRVTHYQYDHSSRLAVIKDQDGNIIKTYNYNYVNQPH